jgi:hypothetical protein
LLNPGDRRAATDTSMLAFIARALDVAVVTLILTALT